MNDKEFIKKLAKVMDIQINGDRPWDIQVKHEEFYKTIIKRGSIGLGESYMQGMWECQALDQFFAKITRFDPAHHIKSIPLSTVAKTILYRIFNQQSIARSKKVGKKHYDLGNKMYQLMLDKELNYSCGYWKNADNLDQAQFNKLDLICRKIGLKAGDRVLDIGCGWGGFARHAAKHYGAHVVGVTISQEQWNLANELSQGYAIDLRLQDYRLLTAQKDGQFDHVISIGMFEHVGYKNYARYFKKVAELLKDDGLFLLHTIGNNPTVFVADPWIEKYIFPNGILPSTWLIAHDSEKYFCIEDWHNFGADYDTTLMAWQQNFVKHWDVIKTDYDEVFYRMWNYYLLACAGAFRSRSIHLWQVVFSKKGILGGYQTVR